MRPLGSLLIHWLAVLCITVRLGIADDTSTLKVGMLLPLSGPLTEMGSSFKRGVELYLSDHPSPAVSYLFEDHKYDGKTTVTALHALRSQAGVNLTVVWGNTPAAAAAPVAEQQRIPTLAISMNPDAKDRGYVVSLGPPVAQVAKDIEDRLQSVDVAHAAAVTIDIGNALEVIELVDRGLGGGTLKKVVSGDEVDFKPVISQLRSRSIDGVVLFLLPQQALTFLRQAKQFNYSPHIVGGDIFAVESFQNDALKFTNKAGFVYGAVRPNFIERLAKHPAGTSYFFEVATGYSVAAMIAHAAQRIKSPGYSGDILAELSALQPTDLPLESIHYRRTQDFGRHFEVGTRFYSLPVVQPYGSERNP